MVFYMISLLLILLIVFFLARRNSFTANFMAISSVCFYFFFVYPLLSLYGLDSFYYVGFYHSFNMQLFYFALFCGFVFVIGFFSFDLFLILKKRKKSFTADFWKFKNEYEKESRFIFYKYFYIIVTVFLIYHLYGFLDFNRAADGYDIRTGEVQGSWLMFFIGIFVKETLNKSQAGCSLW